MKFLTYENETKCLLGRRRKGRLFMAALQFTIKLLKNDLSPNSRVLLEKATAAYTVKILTYVTQSAGSLTCSKEPATLSYPKPSEYSQNSRHTILKAHFNIILPLMVMFLELFLSLEFSKHVCMHFSSIPFVIHNTPLFKASYLRKNYKKTACKSLQKGNICEGFTLPVKL